MRFFTRHTTTPPTVRARTITQPLGDDTLEVTVRSYPPQRLVVVCASIEALADLQQFVGWRRILAEARQVGAGLWQTPEGQRIQFATLSGDVARLLRQARDAVVFLVMSREDIAHSPRAQMVRDALASLEALGITEVYLVHPDLADMEHLIDAPLIYPEIAAPSSYRR